MHRRPGLGGERRQARTSGARAGHQSAHGHQALPGARDPRQDDRSALPQLVPEGRDLLSGADHLGGAARLRVREPHGRGGVSLVRVQAALLRVHSGGRSGRGAHATNRVRAEAQAHDHAAVARTSHHARVNQAVRGGLGRESEREAQRSPNQEINHQNHTAK